MLVHHPKFADVTRDVSDAEVDNWVAQGWVPDAPPAEPDPVDTPADVESVRPKSPKHKADGD